MSEKTNDSVVRFALSQRIEHILLMISFSMLCLTGIPQKFYNAGWARAILGLLGGIQTARYIHHFFAAMFLFEAIYHAVVVAYELIFLRPRRLGMLPGIRDVRDGLHSVSYLLGLKPEPPRYDRFDFKQKVEYWAMIWGTVSMGATGLILLFPVVAMRYVPWFLMPVAKVIHGYEAILAFLAIITWHFYSAHLTAGVFPLDTSIFTGKISRERMMEEHSLEYDRLLAGKEASDSAAGQS